MPLLFRRRLMTKKVREYAVVAGLVLLFAAHLYIGGATYGRSERALHVSEAYASRPEALPAVSYAALGHIHKPQALGSGVPARYAGSPIQLDFGEEGEDKTTALVEAHPGRPAAIEVRPITSGRRLLSLESRLEDLAAHAEAARGMLVHVTVRSDEPIPDVGDQVRDLLRGAVILDVTEDVASRRLEVLSEAVADAAAEQSIPQLFEAYLAEQATRGAPAARVLATFTALFEAAENETAAALDGREALTGAYSDAHEAVG